MPSAPHLHGVPLVTFPALRSHILPCPFFWFCPWQISRHLHMLKLCQRQGFPLKFFAEASYCTAFWSIVFQGQFYKARTIVFLKKMSLSKWKFQSIFAYLHVVSANLHGFKLFIIISNILVSGFSLMKVTDNWDCLAQIIKSVLYNCITSLLKH